jgi:F-type H+-transporting ATPase subunit delta
VASRPRNGAGLESERALEKGSSIVSGVADRYASALFDLARESNAVDAVKSDLDALGALLEESADLRRLVRSPVFSADEQLKAITAVLEAAQLGALTANFVKVVVKNRRLFALPGMIEAFANLIAKERGEVTAEVTSAEPLSEAQSTALAESLRDKLGKVVALRAKVDPSLIGGLIVRVGSRMIDTSLRTKLNTLKVAMREVR